MPEPSTAHLDDLELRVKEPAAPEEMEHRERIASRLRALMDRPITEAEKAFWQDFDAELEKDRLSFR
jgi:rubrerythrin